MSPAVARTGTSRGAALLVAALPAIAGRTDNLGSRRQRGERDRILLTAVVPQEEHTAEDVDPADLPFSVRQREAASDLREFAGRLLVEIELVPKAALEPAARAGDLGRTRRESL